MEKLSTLGSLIRVQAGFQDELQRRKYGRPRGVESMTTEERTEAIKSVVLGVVEEVVELNKEFVYKMHEPDGAASRDRAKIVEEFVDALKYLLSIPVYAGISVDEILDEYDRKSREVWEKFQRRYPEVRS